MDVQMRCWCDSKNQVIIRYCDSHFQYHTNANALNEALVKSLPPSPIVFYMHQLVGDGPNVNWNVLSNVRKIREEEEISRLDDIGSCRLHIVSGAFRGGVKLSEWGIEKIL